MNDSDKISSLMKHLEFGNDESIGSKTNEDPSYLVYLDMVSKFLKDSKKRLLSDVEEKSVVAHLKAAVLAYSCNHCKRRGDGREIIQVLITETVKKVNELREDFLVLSEEEVNQMVKEVLTAPNYLQLAVHNYLSDVETRIVEEGITNVKTTPEKKVDLKNIAEVASKLYKDTVSRFRGVPVKVDEGLIGQNYYIAVSQELFKQINNE